jgi:CelD/BcsL family acetyltransferase involved in cellulose biosynthesis
MNRCIKTHYSRGDKMIFQKRLVTSMKELESYQEAWDEILKHNNNNNPFITFDWIKAWWDYFGEDFQLQVEVLCNDKEIIAFLPLMKREKKFIEEVFFIGFRSANYMDFVVKDEMREQVIKHFLNSINDSKQNSLFHLHGLLKSNRSPAILKKELVQRKIPFFQGNTIAPFLDYKEVEFSKYLKPRQKKHGLDRREKKLHKLGEVTFQPLAKDAIDDIFSLHAKRWSHKIETSGFSEEGKTKQFFKHLLENPGSSIQPVVNAYSIDNRMIGFMYGFICEDRYVFYVAAHDDDFGIFSPGKSVIKEQIKKCDELQLGIFDFSLGFEPYKFDWNNGEDFAIKFVFPSKNVKAKFYYYLISLKESLIFLLKKNRRIVLFRRNTLGKVRGTVRELKHQLKSKGVKNSIQHLFRNLFANREKQKEWHLFKLVNENTVENKDLVVKQAKVADLENLSSIYNLDKSAIVSRWYKKHLCYLVEKDNKLIAAYWVNEKSIEVEGLSYKESLSSNERFIYDLQVIDTTEYEDYYTLLLEALQFNESCERLIICANSKQSKLIEAIRQNTGSFLKVIK